MQVVAGLGKSRLRDQQLGERREAANSLAHSRPHIPGLTGAWRALLPLPFLILSGVNALICLKLA